LKLSSNLGQLVKSRADSARPGPGNPKDHAERNVKDQREDLRVRLGLGRSESKSCAVHSPPQDREV
jgi:hypothetical protein